MDKKEMTTVSGSEQVQVVRALLLWLNQYPDFPADVKRIEAEYLSQESGIGLFSVTAPYKTQEYISGAYEAQYQFALQYRVVASFSSERLNAMDVLDNIASWSEKQEKLPNLGDRKKAVSIERNSTAVMLARYDNGAEDYQILMAMNYEVRP